MTDTEDAIAARLMELWGTDSQDAGIAVADMGAAARITARVRDLRMARGERAVGRKIGFSNRTLWPLYGVDRPMWNYMWDSTVTEAPGGAAVLDLAGLPEPRIEPEIVLSLARAPAPEMDEAALLGCIDRVAHGFEIVQSVFPGWKFTAAGTAAAFGLHGRLVIGPWRDIGSDRAGWGAQLAGFTVSLRRGGAEVDAGHARNVLDGPVTAFRHLVRTLADDPSAVPLAAGEVVTTGTVTDAHPVAPGETWSTRLAGIDLPGMTVTFL